LNSKSTLNDDRTCVFYRVPGGSAANVAKCLAMLMPCHENCIRNKVSFSGTLGCDDTGNEYRVAMEASDVDMSHAPTHESQGNGICLCIVTPDGQRTMRTCLRASQDHVLSEKDISCIRPRWTHFEGYYVHKSDTILDTMKSLKRRGSSISFDFASFDVVNMYRDVFLCILDARVLDVLFCNEHEAYEFASLIDLDRDNTVSEEEYVERFIRYMVDTYDVTMVVSRGAHGCMAGTKKDGIASSPADTVTVVDTIGAGDHFSAGFIYALMNGARLEEACRCACMAGGTAVQVQGAQIPDDLMSSLKSRINTIVFKRA
jgi:sugar/nucleoside kinase (ribokinase family)